MFEISKRRKILLNKLKRIETGIRQDTSRKQLKINEDSRKNGEDPCMWTQPVYTVGKIRSRRTTGKD
ncbi:hypothetical protein L596_022513 [Steinernema carpocapsae]|uniref:Uncharacterized protein n=1 Tax=Steinernema carpocapsae TaxID=34508 RepID=A0A4U5MLX7_STECR|nr:hypothetical protein L596_022513 [Steinernema carpocapsae]